MCPSDDAPGCRRTYISYIPSTICNALFDQVSKFMTKYPDGSGPNLTEENFHLVEQEIREYNEGRLFLEAPQAARDALKCTAPLHPSPPKICRYPPPPPP